MHGLSHEVDLERLQEHDVAAYLNAEFRPNDLPETLSGLIFRQSDGNPLFMVAMLDHLVKTGVLSLVHGRWTLARTLNDGSPGMPDTLKQMLELQLQHASEPERQLLAAASVAGQTFTQWAVETMLPEDAARVEEMCDALITRQRFLRASGTRELSDDVATPEYRFTHALYREVLYRKLSATQRVTFHRRLASGLERLRSPAETDMAAEIALHFAEGQDYHSAIRHLMVAAENATRRYSHQQAIEILEHARQLLDKVPEPHRAALDLATLERVGQAYYASGAMDQSAKTYESMAVRAAAAGVLSAKADELIRLVHTAETIPFLMKAIELDPDMVSVYTSLSRIFSNLGEVERAKDFARCAYERRDQVGERERLSIVYQYHYEVSGDQLRAAETLESWKELYPLEFQPVNSLAVMHNFLGNFERAIAEGREAVRRNPGHGYPYSNLSHAYRGLGQFDAAQNTAEQAVALQIETLPTRRLLYQLAVLTGDQPAALRHLEWARDKPREFDMVGAHAQATGWAGKVRDARRLYEQAVRLAELRNLPDVGSSHLAWAASMELAFGYMDAAGQVARCVLARTPSYDPRLRAAMVLAGTESSRDAEGIVAELVRANPAHTLINSVLAPIVRASIALDRKQPARAIAELETVAPYELGFIAALAPLHLRAQAYLMSGSGRAAADEFERILTHRGSDPFSPFHAVAVLGLARAHRVAGDNAKSLHAYERFLTAWSDADADIPVLRDARDECSQLRHRS